MARYKRLRILMTIACAIVVGTVMAARAEEPAADRTRPENADGRIYTSITWHSEGTAGQGIVGISPQTGKCETIVPDGLGPRISPDGRTIAFCKMADFGKASEVFLVGIGGDGEPHLIWTGEGNAKVCWPHDGKHVIISQSVRSADQKNWQFTTWLVDADNAEASQLKLPTTEGVVDCAHKSDLLISWSFRNKSRIELFTLLPDGTQATNLTDKGQYDYQGRFSADDKKIAFLRRQRGLLNVCTSDADGKNAQVAFTEKDLTYPNEVCWSPDAKRVAVVLFDWTLDEQGKKVRRGSDDSHFRIAIMDLDGANYRELPLDRAVNQIGAVEWR
jgi:Tol biopolymer transport system component